MRIICLVPSISETLLACQVNLVGRSRFCIHPEQAIQSIPKVGGTKDVDWDKVLALQPDLVILDKEENTKDMAENCPVEYFALHITQLGDVATELARLGRHINNNALIAVANRWKKVANNPLPAITLQQIPGIIRWWSPPTTQTDFEYLIWKDPWMAIGNQTFIQSMLDHCGLNDLRRQHAEKYPVIDFMQLSPQQTLLLFSSEPFPFERHSEELTQLGFACALIDGEQFSWYGVRSLSFLEQLADR